MARSTKEWRGKTDDSKAPPKVRQRVLDKHLHRCHICDQPITDRNWEADHVVAIINGGENRESNLAPAHRECHRRKTRKDVAEKSKVAQVRMKASGAIQPKQSIKSRGFPQTRKREPKRQLPRVPLYQEATR